MAAYLSALGLNCALGQGKQAVAAALFAGDTRGMRLQSGWQNVGLPWSAKMNPTKMYRP